MIGDKFKELGCDYWREQYLAYGGIDFRDKTVIMVGADCGTTIVYALLRGARYVIGYEKNEELRKKWETVVCKELYICDRAEMKGEWRGDEYLDGDVFLMDCEGCEQLLDFTRLSKYKDVCIALHSWTERRDEILAQLVGYIITYVTPDKKEVVFCHYGHK